MSQVVIMSGNVAVANALRQIDPHVYSGYPITPSTKIMEKVAEYIADGKMQCEMISVESEHSAMSAAIGSAASGARVASATSANGLGLMWETLYIASGFHLPIFMAVGNRALSAPINGFADHGESMGARDSGWIQLYCENVQEAYDNTIQAYKIAENSKVRLPIMVCLDGFLLTHTSEDLIVEEDSQIVNFVGEFQTQYSLLNFKDPVNYGVADTQDYYMEHKMLQHGHMENALDVIEEVGTEFGELFGRNYGLVERYQMKDAEMAIVILGSESGRVKDVVDELRSTGTKVGVLRIRSFRPFPSAQILEALAGLKAVAVMDRSFVPGAVGAPIYHEVLSTLYSHQAERPAIINRIYGLGGRVLKNDDIKTIVGELDGLSCGDRNIPDVRLVGLREQSAPSVKPQVSFNAPSVKEECIYAN